MFQSVDVIRVVCLSRGLGDVYKRLVLFFFFQAEDGIRDFCLSRGLGDVYKRQRVDRLNQIDRMEQQGQFDVLPKKEVIRLQHEREKLEANLGGIREMKKLPGALFVVDPRKEHIAVSEARALGIPIVAIVDTNCDPDEIDYVIPGNDDAIRAVKLIAGKLADAVLEGRQGEQDAHGEAAPCLLYTSDAADE